MEIVKKIDLGSTIKDNPPEAPLVVNLYEDKAPQVMTETPVVESAEVIQTDIPTEVKLSRRDAFKRAAEMERKANEKEKLANQKLAKAQEFEKIMEKAKTDPTVIAQAFGVDPAEFLRQYQNQMWNVKEEQVQPKIEIKPEEELKQRLDRLEQEKIAEQTRNQEMQYNSVKANYISNSILPVIADAEKFQLLNGDAKDHYVSYIYDMMDAHYRATGGRNGGEILSVESIAEELENHLTKEQEENLNKLKSIPKFSKRFREEQAAEVQAVSKSVPPVKALSANIGKNSSGGIPKTIIKDDNIQVVDLGIVSSREARKAAKLAATKEWLKNRNKS